MSDHQCLVYRLGLVPYQDALALQEQLARKVAVGEQPPTLLLLEHPHTFTLGRSGQVRNLLWTETELRRRGVQVLWVDRGGDVTYHGPGQLVGYPLLPLGHGQIILDESSGRPRLPQGDFIAYLRALEETLIQALAPLGISATRLAGLTGVWVQANPSASSPEGERTAAKIASIGVKVDAQGVSRHGFALNISPDMSYWEGIIGCGLEGYPVTSLAELLQPAPSMIDVMDSVVTAFGETLGFRMESKQGAFAEGIYTGRRAV